MILKLVIWSILCYSVTSILAESYIFMSLRTAIGNFNKSAGIFVRCMLCTGVWVSFLYSLFLWSPTDVIFGNEYSKMYVNFYNIDMTNIVVTFIRTFNDGVFGGAVVYFYHVIENRLRK